MIAYTALKVLAKAAPAYTDTYLVAPRVDRSGPDSYALNEECCVGLL